MPDVAIKPAISLEEGGKLPDYGRPVKLIPAYLVTLDAKKGSPKSFIATKFDDAFVNCGKFVGFYYEGDIDTVIGRHSEIIEAMPVANFVEILIPWIRIESIRSLVYRHKVTGERK